MRVRLTPAAFEDLTNIAQWHSPSVAKRIEAAVFAATDRFEKCPELAVATDEEDTRRWPIADEGVTIFYRIEWGEKRIDVLRIMDGRQVHNLKRVPR